MTPLVTRIARYYTIDFDQTLVCEENTERKEKAEKLDGSYVMRTDRKGMTDEEIIKTYLFLTHVKTAFRDMKSPFVLPTDIRKLLRIRNSSTPEEEHKKIYDLLNMPYEIMKHKKWWSKE